MRTFEFVFADVDGSRGVGDVGDEVVDHLSGERREDVVGD